jgi:hypothetical protein
LEDFVKKLRDASCRNLGSLVKDEENPIKKVIQINGVTQIIGGLDAGKDSKTGGSRRSLLAKFKAKSTRALRVFMAED